MKMQIKSHGSYRYDIYGTWSRHGHKYREYQKVSQYDDAYIY